MMHDSNYKSLRVLELGRMLGLNTKDIQTLQKKVVNNERRTGPTIAMQNPVDSYKEPCGPYYGTVSVHDF
jgi:hypothetical protein